MLGTAQAVKEWDDVIKLLAGIKAAHLNQRNTPANLARGFANSNSTLAQNLASPLTTWKQLLQKEVKRFRCRVMGPTV